MEDLYGGELVEHNFDRAYIEDIYKGAKEVFCNGIYVKSSAHPCGWDFISFEGLDFPSDAFDEPIGIYAISGGNYDTHDFADMTLEDIISTVGIHGWCFEISGVDELK